MRTKLQEINVRSVFVLFTVLIAGLWAAQSVSAQSTVVKVEGGSVQGVATADVLSWKDIPYAAPPVGDLRWRNPQPVKPWQGVKDASTFGPDAKSLARARWRQSIYPATVTEVRAADTVVVHYHGHEDVWDEVISIDRILSDRS